MESAHRWSRHGFTRHVLCLAAVLVGPVVSPAHGDESSAHGIHSIEVPCGVAGALAAIDSPGTPERARFVVEVTRRFYNTPRDSDRSQHPALAQLTAWLSACSQPRAATLEETPGDTVPLPLSPEVWTGRIFGGQATLDGLAAAILTTRSAALLYTGLLSLDEATRGWLVAEPGLLETLHRDHAATFMVAAPALRVAEGRLVLPGGESARPVWESLTRRSADDAARFALALIEKDRGLLAWFFASLHVLPAPQLRAVLKLDAADARVALAAASELYSAFRLAARAWDPRARPFWRPAVDPAILLLELELSPRYPSGVPGTTGFWREVFRRDHLSVGARDVQRAAGGQLPTAGWIVSRVLARDPEVRRARADQVLYAARQREALNSADTADALTAVRAVGRVPAVVLSLERAGTHDIGLVARLARGSDAVAAIRQPAQAFIAHAQWQGSLAVLLGAAAEGAVPPDRLRQALRELAALTPDRAGRFEGRVLAWSGGWVPGAQADRADPDRRSVERAWMRWLSGDSPERLEPARPVVWEGETYLLDVSAANARRMDDARGPESLPAIDLAFLLHAAASAGAGGAAGLGAGAGAGTLDAWDPVERMAQVEEGADVLDHEVRSQWRVAVDALGRSPQSRPPQRVATIRTALTRAADALLARGLLELSYARVLADHEDMPLTPGEAASRHVFDGTSTGGAGRVRLPWSLPAVSTAGRGWHVTGSLLALDVALAPNALRRVTAHALAGRPTLNDMDRRTFVETVVLTSRAALTDASRDGIAAALARGREYARTAASDHDARRAFAARVGMSPDRETLWPWMLAHEPHRAGIWVAPRELLHAGLDGEPMPQDWHAWGTSTLAATGCLCTRLAPPVPPEIYAGHVGSSLVAVAVPDLQLRVAEALAHLGMPAMLGRDVLAPAVYDLVNRSPAQDHDDWRALLEHIHGVDTDRVEDYLALFTVEGPLYTADALAARPQP